MNHDQFPNPNPPEQAEDTAAPVPEPLEALSGAVGRGRHLALIAAEGAGLARLYAAAAARDLAADDGDGGRIFVLTDSVERSRRCAAGMYETARAAGYDVVVVAPGATMDAAARASILVGPPGPLLEAVRKGDVSATALRGLVLDDVRALAPAWAAVEALLQASGEETRRVAATHARDAGFDELIGRWLPRARRWPNELFARRRADAPGGDGGSSAPVSVASRATRTGRLARLVDLLHEIARAGAATAVSVETASAAVEDVRAALATAGFAVAGAADAPEAKAGVVVSVGAWGEVDPAEHAVAFELPPTPGPLARAAATADRCYAIVDPLHERQFELTAARAGLVVAPLGEPLDAALLDDIAAFRTRVSEALEQQDAASGALLLAPLIEEHGAARVAGALAGLLRAADRARPAAQPGQPPATGDARAATRPEARADRHVRRATRPTWTRVFVGVGKRDGAGPGDLVGAITGETPASGGQIGRIEIRHNFSLVDVDSLVADEVVRGLDGRRIKGRDVVARLDRDAAAG
ncbi:DbpA RNA binding domain-containing protein [Candidatus Palauibacter sp.]|uniref:DbpA RNA binding domain-containing protein n=1 Tax=Candidatus Palauibacter sp. TaxID=3101350 RepID=UPI003B021AFD